MKKGIEKYWTNFIGAKETSEKWEDLLNGLKERGVQEVLLGVMDGLPGIEEAFL
jgi:Transposase and inactivated derivatives